MIGTQHRHQIEKQKRQQIAYNDKSRPQLGHALKGSCPYLLISVGAFTDRISIDDVLGIFSTARSPGSGVVAHICLAVQVKLVRVESIKESAFHTSPFNFNLDDAMGTQGIGV